MTETLEGFGMDGLLTLLDICVCGRDCKAVEAIGVDEACDTCPASKIKDILERQIEREGIRYMKALIKEWGSRSKEGQP